MIFSFEFFGSRRFIGRARINIDDRPVGHSRPIRTIIDVPPVVPVAAIVLNNERRGYQLDVHCHIRREAKGRTQNAEYRSNAEESPEARKLAGVSNLPFFAVFSKGQLVKGDFTSKQESVEGMIDLIRG
jgi:hypothetical protein